MNEVKPSGDQGKENKSRGRTERGGFLASWLSKSQAGDSLFDANERKDEKDHETGGARGRFKLAWGKMFGKIGAAEEIDVPMSTKTTASKESTRQLGSILAEQEKVADHPEVSEAIAPVSDEYRGELHVAHNDEAGDEQIAQEDTDYSLGLKTAPLLPGTAAESDQKRREYMAKPAIIETVSSANTTGATATLRQEGFIKPTEKPEQASPGQELAQDDMTDSGIKPPAERIYELSHEAKELSSQAASGAVQLGDILANYPKAPPLSKPEPAPIQVPSYTPEPMAVVAEMPEPFNPRPGSMASESLSSPSSLSNPVTIMPPADKPVIVEPPSPLWQTPEPEPDKYRQAVANGFWGGIIVVFLMAVFYLFT